MLLISSSTIEFEWLIDISSPYPATMVPHVTESSGGGCKDVVLGMMMTMKDYWIVLIKEDAEVEYGGGEGEEEEEPMGKK